jgi:6-pyruvoyltetrahydropterin/6-carboxytetrahydropterin synthase
MFELTVETTFSAAHQLKGYTGKCERLHGHNWKVQVHVIAVDFQELKRVTNEVVSTLDHSMLNEIFPFTEKNPSSENIAKWIYDSLRKKINDENIHLSAVTVWESETSSATYYET